MAVADQVRLALVQPHSHTGSFLQTSIDPRGLTKNVETTQSLIARGAAQGANLIVFPEFFPGPTRLVQDMPYDDVVASIVDSASRHGVTVSFGGIQPAADGVHCYNCHHLVLPSGQVHVYKKMIPAISEVSALPGEGPVVVHTELGEIGLLICWEAWFPELARMAALKGAELLLFPTGGLIYELRPVWSAILQARAAENTAYAVATVSLYGAEDGMACAFGPEGCLGSLQREGMLCVDLDMERLRTMRSMDEEFTMPKRFRTIPGVLRSLSSRVVMNYERAATAFLNGAAQNDHRS